MRSKETTFRFGDLSKKIVKYGPVEDLDEYNSFKDFAEKSVRFHAPDLRQAVAGGVPIRVLVRLLNDLPRVDETLPTVEVETTIKDESLSDRPAGVELSPEALKVLDDIADRSGLTQSEAIRFCVYRELSELSSMYEYEPEWRKREIDLSYAESRNSLEMPKTKFYEILHRRFTLLPDQTKDLIAEDPDAFKDFAEEYKVNFYESEAYDQIREKCGTEAFDDVEEMIEERTDIELDPSNGPFFTKA